MKKAPKLMVLLAAMALAGCDSGMGRGHPAMPPMPPPPPPPDSGMGRGGPAPPPPPPDYQMQPYDPDQYYGSGEPPSPVGDSGMGRGAPPRHRMPHAVRDSGMGRGAPQHTGPNPVSSTGPQRGHEVSCEVTGVDTDKAKFTCREHHASWTFHVSPRSDTLGELHKGQHVRVLYSKHRSGYDAEDVQPLPDAMRPARGN